MDKGKQIHSSLQKRIPRSIKRVPWWKYDLLYLVEFPFRENSSGWASMVEARSAES